MTWRVTSSSTVFAMPLCFRRSKSKGAAHAAICSSCRKGTSAGVRRCLPYSVMMALLTAIAAQGCASQSRRVLTFRCKRSIETPVSLMFSKRFQISVTDISQLVRMIFERDFCFLEACANDGRQDFKAVLTAANADKNRDEETYLRTGVTTKPSQRASILYIASIHHRRLSSVDSS